MPACQKIAGAVCSQTTDRASRVYSLIVSVCAAAWAAVGARGTALGRGASEESKSAARMGDASFFIKNLQSVKKELMRIPKGKFCLPVIYYSMLARVFAHIRNERHKSIRKGC